LSIVIVNWNSVSFLKDCIDSIYSSAGNIPFEIIVVDNASHDGAGEMLKKDFPEVRFKQLETNLGFATANNCGFRLSSGKYLLFLNPDTVCLGNAISTMIASVKSNQSYGAIGCRLLNSDRTIQTTSVLPFPTIMNQVLGIEYLRKRIFKWNGLKIRFLYATTNSLEPVEAISGACMLIPREIIDKVGGFSEEYFMYSEDVDICTKIRNAGYAIIHDPSAEIIHFGGGSTANRHLSKFSTVVMRHSNCLLLAKFRGSLYAKCYCISQLAVAITRLFLMIFMLPFFMIQKKSIAPVFYKWLMVASWALGFESWCKKLK
jgi:GT2 family glycosyltransferase